MKRTPLRRISSKRAKQVRAYSRIRLAYLAQHKYCQCCQVMKACDIHHKAGRRGEMLNETNHWLAVCRDCHNFIHANPRIARAYGWLI